MQRLNRADFVRYFSRNSVVSKVLEPGFAATLPSILLQPQPQQSDRCLGDYGPRKPALKWDPAEAALLTKLVTDQLQKQDKQGGATIDWVTIFEAGRGSWKSGRTQAQLRGKWSVLKNQAAAGGATKAHRR